MPEEKKKTRKYGKYYWIDPKTKLGYCKVQISTGERNEKGKLIYTTHKRRAKNSSHADQIAGELFADYEVRKSGFTEGETMTFAELADWYKKRYCVEPTYSEDGLKSRGMRTFANEIRKIDNIAKFLGKLLIKNIDEDVLYRYKSSREKKGVLPATVNRDLETLKAMFNKAVRRRWLKNSPFDYGDNLIEKALENRREVTLTDLQEEAILEVIKLKEKTLLHYVVVTLLETGARPSEIYDASTIKAEPVTWQNFFELKFKAVKLTSTKGKKKVSRYVPVTKRLEKTLMQLWNSLPADKQNEKFQVFPVKSFKKAWATARTDTEIYLRIAKRLKLLIKDLFNETFEKEAIAKFIKEEKETIAREKLNKEYLKDPIHNVRLRDLRRNWSSVLAKLGVEGDIRQRLLGHEQRQTTFDYTQADIKAVLMVKDLMDENNILSLETLEP